MLRKIADWTSRTAISDPGTSCCLPETRVHGRGGAKKTALTCSFSAQHPLGKRIWFVCMRLDNGNRAYEDITSGDRRKARGLLVSRAEGNEQGLLPVNLSLQHAVLRAAPSSSLRLTGSRGVPFAPSRTKLEKREPGQMSKKDETASSHQATAKLPMIFYGLYSNVSTGLLVPSG